MFCHFVPGWAGEEGEEWITWIFRSSRSSRTSGKKSEGPNDQSWLQLGIYLILKIITDYTLLSVIKGLPGVSGAKGVKV